MALGVLFFPEQCLKSMHRSSKCSLCIDVCPTHAIDFKTTSPQLDSLKCMSCGACVALCPTDVFEAKNPSDEEMICFIEEKQRENTQEIVFTCERIQSKEPHFREIPCLARMDFSLLLSCFTNASVSVKLIHGKCEKCHGSSLEKVFEKSITDVKRMQPSAQIELSTLDAYVAKKDEIIEGITRDGYIRRRMLFSLFGKKPALKEAEILTVQHPIVFKDNLYKQHSFKKHDRLRHFIALMRAHVSSNSIIGVQPTIDPLLCKECSICTKVCPTGALGMNEEKEFGIDYTTHACIACHMCEDVCFAKAITFAPKTMDDMFKNEPVLLFEKEEINQNEEDRVVIFRT
jgi:ferredoxin